MSSASGETIHRFLLRLSGGELLELLRDRDLDLEVERSYKLWSGIALCLGPFQNRPTAHTFWAAEVYHTQGPR